MKRNELKQKYHKETFCYYKDKNGLINKEYMNWLEDELIKQLTLTEVSYPLCACGGNERVALDCTRKRCEHPKYSKSST